MTTPAQAAREREKAKVHRLADIVERCKGDRWMIDTDGREAHVISRRSTGDSAVLCTIYADALPYEIELISGALENVGMLLELRERAIVAFKHVAPAQTRQVQPQRRELRDGNFAANAAMLCEEPLFHRFLERRDQTRAIHNKDHADTVLKKLIGITSKTQLNTQERAQTAFIDLRSDFEAWKERGRS